MVATTRYPTECGHSTEDARKDWIRMYQPKVEPDRSLVNTDPDSPLYFWQLYAILGPERITAILTSFYTRIYADDEAPWFTRVFKQRSMEHHIRVNAHFWIDAMGGGKHFYGGDERLNYFHAQNAKAIMTARGAERWMYHMKNALLEQHFDSIDPRINACIMQFLKVKMDKYAKRFHWDLDNSDFRLPSRMCIIQ